jgi:hypothetical protein
VYHAIQTPVAAIMEIIMAVSKKQGTLITGSSAPFPLLKLDGSGMNGG